MNILIPGNSINALFIDGDSAWSHGTFVSSVNRAALSYTNWRDGEPKNSTGIERCINMDGADGLWSEYSCIFKLPTVCEIDSCKFH